MINIGITQGSAAQAAPLVIGKDTVYVHFGAQEKTDDDGNVFWEYEEVQMGPDEYSRIMESGGGDEPWASVVRQRRDGLLAESDFSQLPDSPLDSTKKNAYKNYRKALRDLTKQAGFPYDIEWPVLQEAG